MWIYEANNRVIEEPGITGIFVLDRVLDAGPVFIRTEIQHCSYYSTPDREYRVKAVQPGSIAMVRPYVQSINPLYNVT
jgi:hypothetical protein